MACHNPDSFIEGILDVWVGRSLLTKNGKNINDACEHLVQLVLYTSLQPYQVVAAIELYIRKMEYKNPDLTISKKKYNCTLNSSVKSEATF
jgi:hypothetical protein